MAKKPAPEDSDASGSAETGSMSESGSASSAGSASEVAESSGDDTEASEAPRKSGPQKKGTGRAARASGRASGSQRSVGGAPKSVRPLGSGNELVPVICSECYEEFVFDSAVRSETLTCPICEHQAARPDDAQLAVIAEKRKQEKTNFVLCTALCLASLLAFGFWVIALRNPLAKNGAMGMVPGIVALLAFLGCAGVSLGKYEGARHEIYF